MIEIINLLDKDGTGVIDSVSSEYEDSFCLESFADLAIAHASVPPIGSRSFIIARVQTWDPKQPDKVIKAQLGILFVLQCLSFKQDSFSNPKLFGEAIYSSIASAESSY